MTDETRATIVGAEVSISNEATGEQRTTTTGAAGNFSFPTVNTGSYSLSVTSTGFQAYTVTGLTVSTNSVVRHDVSLQVGQISSTVTVEASAATLQADRAEVRQEVTEQQLKNVPVPLGRNYQMLFVTLPGFSPPQNAHSVPTNPSRAVRFSVNGTSRSNNNTRIDGASTTNIWVPHMTGYNPALESIESVNVVTNSFDAEQGLAGGAAINIQIKSGTNDIHGSAFEYHNNQKIKAYPWNSDRTQNKPKFIYNQFGGPIKKNKLFYFVSYEGTREAQFAQRFVDVLSPAMRRGDLSEVFSAGGCATADCNIYDPLSGSADGSEREAFANAIVPQSRIDFASQQILNSSFEGDSYPTPNQVGTGEFGLNRNFLGGGSTSFFRDTVDSKVNWHVNDKLSAFVRFSVLGYRMTNGQVFGNLGGNRLHPTNSNPGRGFGNTYSGTVSATYVATPNFVVDGYFGYTLVDTNVEQDNLDINVGSTFLDIPGLESDRRIDGGWPRLRIDGFEEIGISNNFMPYFRSDPQWQYVFNGNWTKGKHNVRFGTDLYLQNLNHNQPEFPGSLGPASGGFRFRQGSTRLNGTNGVANSRGTDFNSAASFLLGFAQDSGKIWQFDPDGYFTRTRFFNFYARDRWQITPKLTMSYGVRYEIFPFPTREDRGLERFDFSTGNILACGVGEIPTDCGINVGENKFVPRIGLAYRVSDDTVVRVGYGITNDPFNWARPLRTNFPILFAQNFDGSGFEAGRQLRDGLPVVTEPDLGNGILDLPNNAAVRTFDENNATRGYIQSWNFTIEKRVAGWIGSVGYVATRSVNQLANLEQNYAPIGTGNSGRILANSLGHLVDVDLFGSLGTAKYDSMQTKLERRFSGGYQLNFAYTWAHGRGFTDEDSGDGPRFFGVPSEYGRSYGDLNQDIRHNFQMNGIYELPFGKGKRMATGGVLLHILGGWQLNNLLSWYSGTPFTVTANGDSLNAPGSSQVADCIGEPNVPGFHGDQGLYLERGAFATVNEARFGSCGVANIHGPGVFNLDFGLFRKFQVKEKVDIQFRAEMFNVTNTPHFNNPNSNISSGNFGLVNSIRNTGREGIDERIFRFGIRVGW